MSKMSSLHLPEESGTKVSVRPTVHVLEVLLLALALADLAVYRSTHLPVVVLDRPRCRPVPVRGLC